MPTDIADWLRDGQSTYTGGASTAFDPDLLPLNQLAWGKNISLRGGKIKTRGAFVERKLFDGGLNFIEFPAGRVQGIDYFTANGGQMITSVAGRIFQIKMALDEFTVEELALPVARSPVINEVFMVETDGVFVIQDGESTPIIYDGVSIRLAESDEVPKGTHMAYGNGRLWVNIGNGRVKTGDIVATIVGGNSELKFLEDTYLQGGGAFVMPSDVLGMAFIPSNDGTTGFGALIIMGTDYTVAMRADIATRSIWSDVEGFQTEVFPQLGTSGHFSIVRANQDFIWRDNRGDFRELRKAVADYQQAGSTPQSREIARITENETEDILLTAHSIYNNSRMLGTASPFFVFEDIVGFRDIVSQDFAPLGAKGIKGQPIYNGEWEGFISTHAINVTHEKLERAFFISKDDSGKNRLWEYVDSGSVDISLDNLSDPLVVLLVSGITSVATTATATTIENHGYSVSQVVTLAGASEDWADGAITITATPLPKTFEFTILDQGGASASGDNITVSTGGVKEVPNNIVSEVEFRKTNFERDELKKRLARFDTWVSDIQGTIKVTIYYRPDSNPQWFKYDDFEFCTTITDASTDDPHVFKELRAGQQPQVLPFTSENLDNSLIGFDFQIKLRMEGHMKIDKVVAYAKVLPNQEVYADIDRPKIAVCAENEITPVELFYEIPVFNTVFGSYTDESGNNYEDESGTDYEG